MVKQTLTDSYQIGDWNFSISLNQLDNNEELVQLTSYQTAILAQLITHFPQPVTSDFLLDNISDELNLSRNKLYQSIAKLRKVFNDSVHKAQYIETVSKQGYRLTIKPVIAKEQPLYESDQVDTAQSISPPGLFDDLSFIQNEVETSPEPDLVLEPEFESQFEYSAGSIMAQDIEADTNANALFFRRNMIIAAAFFTIVIIFLVQSLFETPSAIKPVIQYPDKVVVAAPTFSVEGQVTAEQLNLSTFDDVNRNIAWTQLQQLQHLPIIKVLEDDGDGESFPRLVSHITYHADHFTLQQSLYSQDGDQGQHFDLTQFKYTQADISLKVDRQLIKALVGELTITLPQNRCSFEQLASTSLSSNTLANSFCLAQFNHRLSGLLAKLELAPAPSVMVELTGLVRQLKQRFPDHSLSFSAQAKLALVEQNLSLAIDAYHDAIELNGSNESNFIALAKIYREQQDYQQSLTLIEMARNLVPHQQRLSYWYARDIQLLGQFYRAQQINDQTPAISEKLFDKLRFSHINYNTLLEIAQNKQPLPQYDQDLGLVISAAHRGLEMPALKAIEQQTNKYFSNLDISVLTEDDFKVMADKILYLPHYARLLIEDQQQEQANLLLENLVVFFGQLPQGQVFGSTQLAETYALLGHSAKAIEELSRVVSSGWMPDKRYDVASLKDNPNFNSLLELWQFRVLVQLVENRQLLLRKITTAS